MIVSINQPAYLPWLGYFDRIYKSDLHVVLDDVHLESHTKTAFTTRNKISTSQGWSWLTVPVKTAGLNQPLISKVEIENQLPWALKHRRGIEQRYGKSRYFGSYKELLSVSYEMKWSLLNELLKAQTDWLLEALQIGTPVVRTSDLKIGGTKSERVLNICQHFGATTYLSGALGRGYLDLEAFDSAGIEVMYHDYAHPCYAQGTRMFEPYMSIADLLYNCGPESLRILSNS